MNSNSILAEFKLKIDHHGNVVNPISLNKTQIDLQAVELIRMKFSSELIKQHLKRVSEIVPVNTFVVLYGDKDGVLMNLINLFSKRNISFSYRRGSSLSSRILCDTLEIDIELDEDQKSIFILQKKKTTLIPIKISFKLNL